MAKANKHIRNSKRPSYQKLFRQQQKQEQAAPNIEDQIAKLEALLGGDLDFVEPSEPKVQEVTQEEAFVEPAIDPEVARLEEEARLAREEARQAERLRLEEERKALQERIKKEHEEREARYKEEQERKKQEFEQKQRLKKDIAEAKQEIQRLKNLKKIGKLGDKQLAQLEALQTFVVTGKRDSDEQLADEIVTTDEIVNDTVTVNSADFDDADETRSAASKETTTAKAKNVVDATKVSQCAATVKKTVRKTAATKTSKKKVDSVVADSQSHDTETAVDSAPGKCKTTVRKTTRKSTAKKSTAEVASNTAPDTKKSPTKKSSRNKASFEEVVAEN